APAPGATAAAPADAAARPAVARTGDAAEAPRMRRSSQLPLRTVVVAKPVKGAERNRGRLTVTTATQGDDERTRSVASFRRRVQRMKGGRAEQKEKVFREVILPETITIQELANRMSERGVDIIRMLMKQG